MPHRERRIRAADQGLLLRTGFHARGLDELAALRQAGEHLRSARIEFLALGSRGLLSARIARFPDSLFLHASLPETVAVWSRDQPALADRATLVFARAGHIEIASGEQLIRREPGLTLIPPGSSAVRLSASSAVNEAVCVSVSAPVIADILASLPVVVPTEAVDPTHLAPLLAFATNMCTVSDSVGAGVPALKSAAREIARSLVRLAVAGPARPRSLYSLATEIIVSEHHDPTLTTDAIAERLSVTPRTLQVEFKRRGATVSSVLRRARALSAIELRREHTHLLTTEIAQRCGFGSVSSMFRAIREHDASDEVPLIDSSTSPASF